MRELALKMSISLDGFVGGADSGVNQNDQGFRNDLAMTSRRSP